MRTGRHDNLQFYITGSRMLQNMAEGGRDEAVKPYRFELLADSDYSDNE